MASECPEDRMSAPPKEEKGPPKINVVQQALNLVMPHLELFHDPEGTGFARVEQKGHVETYRIRGNDLHKWISYRFYREGGKPLKGADMGDVLSVLEAKATFEGQEHKVYIRVANVGERVFLDLGNPDWEVVEVDAQGWRVIPSAKCPVRFRRAPGMLPLPTPEPGGSLEELREFLNCDEDGFILAIGWKLAALHGQGPFPILVIGGRQGTGKTTAARVIRGTLDPSTASDRGAPNDVRDAVIACSNAWVQSWDNLSSMKPELSDAACRIATGAGFSTRKLFTDGDEHITHVRRPIMVNGIPDLLSRGDFAERALVVRLQPIPDAKRKTEAAFWQSFEAAQPRILGALLDVLSGALLRLPETTMDRMPRMADFARLIAAAEPDCPWHGGDFMRAYEAGRQEAATSVLDGDAVAQAIMKLAGKRREEGKPGGVFEGSAADLLAKLAQGAEKGEGWPRSPKGLVNHLERIAPAMAFEGYRIERRRTRTSRLVVISFLLPTEEEEASHTSHDENSLNYQGFDGDASRDTSVFNASFRHGESDTLPLPSDSAIPHQPHDASSKKHCGSRRKQAGDAGGTSSPSVVPFSRVSGGDFDPSEPVEV